MNADVGEFSVPRDVLVAWPRTLAERYRAVPLMRDGERLRVAIPQADDLDALDAVAYATGLAVDAVVVAVEEIDAAIGRSYALPDARNSAASSPEETLIAEEFAIAARVTDRSSPDATEKTDGNFSVETDDAPIIALVHHIIAEGVRRGASDIHLEPLAKRFRVRYRIDGVLVEVENPPRRLQLPMISRLKIMANISIAEKRRPQDGRIQVTVDGRALDLRVSSLPTVHGESIVMRLLDQQSLRVGLSELGLGGSDRATFERVIAMPDGMVLVTGPTGSGKTTTLYSCLHAINQPDRKIITVEDPVEYQLGGVNQVPVRHDIGMTFSSALRAMLRQAPNVVMVGEVRDLETAEIAINASLTGHMVFSTLHTNDAPGAVTRMIDLGVKPFLVASSLRAVMAQRLVRKICEACREPHVPPAWELAALRFRPEGLATATFAQGRGCPACHGTGYRGRMGIFELMLVDDELERLMHARAGTSALRAAARQQGMRTLREDGLRKASAGLTTIEEVVSITVDDPSQGAAPSCPSHA